MLPLEGDSESFVGGFVKDLLSEMIIIPAMFILGIIFDISISLMILACVLIAVISDYVRSLSLDTRLRKALELSELTEI